MGTVQTFGIELELLCLRPAILPIHASPSNPGSNLIIDAVYDALLRRGVPVSDHNSLNINDAAPSYSQWRVEDEVLSLTPDEQALLPTGYILEPLELASRKFFHAHEDWRAEIAVVLAALDELEALYGVKFITNSSTGFHIHVGDSSSHPLPLRTAKNVLLFCTAHEALIDSMHTVERITIPWGKQERHHCYPLSFFTAMLGLGDTLFERLLTIEEFDSYQQVGSVFALSADDMGTDEACTGHNASVNFDNLFPDEDVGRFPETLTGTIEFRQHAGTLDFAAIASWVECTTALVRYCDEATYTPTATRNFIVGLTAVLDPATTLSESTLPIPADVREYYSSLVQGTLPQARPTLPTPFRAPLYPLLTTNAALLAHSTSRPTILAAIADKAAHGIYGHDPVIAPFTLPDQMVFDMIADMGEKCVEAGFDIESAEGASWVLRAAFAALRDAHTVEVRNGLEE